jgi:hypothetical protein
MTYQEFQDKLHELNCTCDINQRYHQKMAWRWKAADRTIKVLVAFVAILALAAEIAGEPWHVQAIWLAGIAAALAVFLNVVAFGEVERFYDELFHGWADLRVDVENQQVKSHEDSSQEVPDYLIDRLTEMRTKQHSLNAKEPAPWRGLLEKCQKESDRSVRGRETQMATTSAR